MVYHLFHLRGIDESTLQNPLNRTLEIGDCGFEPANHRHRTPIETEAFYPGFRRLALLRLKGQNTAL